tara:strand:+ start:2800 stop:4698 length:1899 start_codon:yes stop_codon:yes gene_type:complete
MMLKIFTILLFNFLFSFFPESYRVDSVSESLLNRNRELDIDNLISGLSSDAIVDLRQGFSSFNGVYMGTFDGVNVIDISGLYDNEIDNYIYHFESESIPLGGNPAIVTYSYENETMIVVSGVASYTDDDTVISYGTGISFSVDNGDTWIYSDQPKDELPECEGLTCNDALDPDNCECHPSTSGCNWHPLNGCSYSGGYIVSDWYGNEFSSNPVTVNEKNVTYDISVDIEQGYIYIASWAGMLRRLKFTDFINGEEQPQNSDWKLVPLPLDGDGSFSPCNSISSNYVYNPVDPNNAGFGGNNNHKAFSVYVDGDKIWVGTADGVNLGTINQSDTNNNGCIDWEHFSTTIGNETTDYLSGDWVVGIEQQSRGDGLTKRTWLISRELISPPTPHGLSYTDDLGENWYIDSQFDDNEDIYENGNENETIVYNLYFDDVCNSPPCSNQNVIESEMYASTQIGLFISKNTDISVSGSANWNWEKQDFPNEIIYDCVQTNKVYTFLEDKGTGAWLVGTPNGLIHSNNLEDSPVWNCEEYVQTNSLVDKSTLNIYPNPITSNQLVNFIIQTDENSGQVDIFDFSMEKVATTNYCMQSYLNGAKHLKCIKQNLVLTNGIYFCRISIGNNEYWEKLMIINNE